MFATATKQMIGERLFSKATPEDLNELMRKGISVAFKAVIKEGSLFASEQGEEININAQNLQKEQCPQNVAARTPTQ